MIQLFCSSIFYSEAIQICKNLESKGLRVSLPSGADPNGLKNPFDYEQDKKSHMAFYRNMSIEKIKKADFCVFLNYDVDGCQGRIGGSSFVEMVLASFLGKKIILINSPSPEQGDIYDDIIGFDYIIIDAEFLPDFFINLPEKY